MGKHLEKKKKKKGGRPRETDKRTAKMAGIKSLDEAEKLAEDRHTRRALYDAWRHGKDIRSRIPEYVWQILSKIFFYLLITKNVFPDH